MAATFAQETWHLVLLKAQRVPFCVVAAVAWDHQKAQLSSAQTEPLSDCLQLHLQAPQAPQHLTHRHHHPGLHQTVLLAILMVAADALHVTQPSGSEPMLTLGRTQLTATTALPRMPLCMQSF